MEVIMKSEYPIYGHESSLLEDRLSEHDKEILNKYMSLCSITAGPNKVKDYRRYMLQFRDVIEKSYDQINKEDAVAFWALLNRSPHEKQTTRTIKSTVKRFLRWYYKDLEMIELLKGTKTDIINPKRVNKSTLFTKEELDLMLHAAERIREKALLFLLIETGARPQEIRDLRWNDINWREKEVHLFSSKTGRDRDLPIFQSCEFLKQWYENWAYPDPQGEDFIFPALARARQPRNKPISTSFINRIVQTLAKKAGIKRRVHSYLLRHSRLTEVYTLGVKGIEHNKFAGHVPGSKQQNVYVHLDNKDMKRTVMEKVYGEKLNDEVPLQSEPAFPAFPEVPNNAQYNPKTGNVDVLQLQRQIMMLQQQLQMMVSQQMPSYPNRTNNSLFIPPNSVEHS